MPIDYRCPHCDKKFSFPDEYAGQRGRCKGCGNTITVPALLETAASPSSPPEPPKSVRRIEPPGMPQATAFVDESIVSKVNQKMRLWRAVAVIASTSAVLFLILVPVSYGMGRESLRAELRDALNKSVADISSVMPNLGDRKTIQNISSVGQSTSSTTPSLASLGLEDAKLIVKVLKVYEVGTRYAKIDFELTNDSKAFIDYWSIDVAIYDANDEYLGHSFTNGSNLRPGESIVEDKLSFSNVASSNIGSWRPRIDSLKTRDPNDGSRVDAQPVFKLVDITK